MVLLLALLSLNPETLSTQLRRLLMWAVLMLPFLRLQTGGVSWGEAIWTDAWQVLLIDCLCACVALALLLQKRIQIGRVGQPTKRAQ